MFARSARNHVDVSVPGALTIGKANCKSVRAQSAGNPDSKVLDNRPELGLLLRVEIIECDDMTPRRHQHMARGQLLRMRNGDTEFGFDPRLLGWDFTKYARFDQQTNIPPPQELGVVGIAGEFRYTPTFMAAIPRTSIPAHRTRSLGLWRWMAVLTPGVLFWFRIWPGLSLLQSRVLGVFLATIVALVAQPVPMGVSVLVAMTLLAVTGTLPPARVLAGFSNLTVWLIFTAFLFARAVTVTGFGMRIGYLFIARFARSPLSLGYSIAAADLVLAPFIPSGTARGGGIVFPLARSVALAFGSEPGPSARVIGSFLMLVAFHATYTASAMFLTGMAANPLIAEFASKTGHVELTWLRWFSGSAVPGLLTLALVPWLLLRWVKPEVRHTEAACELARAELAAMGPLRREEKWLVLIMLGVMAGWVTSPWHGIPNTFVALGGVSTLLLARVLAWDDLLAEHRAWDALVWFAPLVMMADTLD